MAVYNAATYLPQAIDSVLAQTMPSWELLCVDDGSTDGSLRILRDYARRDERIKVITGLGNQGPAKARNAALRVCEGEYITMLDADDWLSADALQSVVDTFDHHPSADSVMFTLILDYPDHAEPFATPYCPGDVLTGKEAFRLIFQRQLHGLYVIRRDIHMRYPYDDSCKLHSDDNTAPFHYLHSRQVHVCAGEYHYRKHAEAMSFSTGMTYFAFLDSNLSMTRLLQREIEQGTGVEASDLEAYEHHRWLQYVDKHWHFYLHRNEFSKEQKTVIRKKLKDFYTTFTQPSPRKFGYTRFASYRHFLIQEWLYFRLKKMMQ